MFWAAAVILVGMVALGVYAACRRADRPQRRPSDRHPPRRDDPEPSHRLFLLGGGVLFPSVILMALLGYGIARGHSLLPLPGPQAPFRVEVTAHQWWWEIRYPDAPGGPVYSANEIHLPAGRPVDLTIQSADVIHSFWVPRLGGKIDAIPGHVNVIRLEADEAGLHAGQCSEFCGAQHARMRLVVEAHNAAVLEERLAALAAIDPAAAAEAAPEAAALFAEHCAACHAIAPGERGAGTGPNLAGVADRHALGAGALGNGEEALLTWLADHQALKPGNRMPPLDRLDDAAVAALADYLARLR